MPKYYVRTKPQLNGIYAVHRENCPFLDDLKKKIYLGEFISSHEAVREAKRYFAHSKECLFCNNQRLPARNNLLQEWHRFSMS
jgi:hypothetical protein